MAGQSTQNTSNWAAIIVVCRCMGNRPPCCLPEPCRPFFFLDARDLSMIPRTTRGKLPESGVLHQIIPAARKRRGHPNGADIASIVARSVSFSSVLAPRNGVPVATLTRPCLEPRRTKTTGIPQAERNNQNWHVVCTRMDGVSRLGAFSLIHTDVLSDAMPRQEGFPHASPADPRNCSARLAAAIDFQPAAWSASIRLTLACCWRRMDS